MVPRRRVVALLLLSAFCIPAAADAVPWPVEQARVSFSFSPGRLAELGLSVTGTARSATFTPSTNTRAARGRTHAGAARRGRRMWFNAGFHTLATHDRKRRTGYRLSESPSLDQQLEQLRSAVERDC